MTKLFFISHAFPPVGGPGVQRAGKLVKYLSRAGYDMSVFCASEKAYDIFDLNLLEDIPDKVKTYRIIAPAPYKLLKYFSIISFEKKKLALENDRPEGLGEKKESLKTKVLCSAKNILRKIFNVIETIFFTPDIFVWWLPFVTAKAVVEIMKEKPAVVLATGGPFSSFIVPFLLNKIFNVPYILDYRDAWTLNPYRVHTNPLKYKINTAIENIILKNAAAVVLVTAHMKKDFEDKFTGLKGKFNLITNGYDSEDFEFNCRDNSADCGSAAGGEKFNITYTGTFTQSRRSYYFLKALCCVFDEKPELKNKVTVNFIGNVGDECRELIKKFGLEENCKLYGYLPHSESVAHLKNSDALLLVTGRDRSELTGKVFEYIYSKKPIFALTNPQGSLAGLLKEVGNSLVACHSDVDEIKRKLKAIIEKKVKFSINSDAVAKYSREAIAGQFDEIIRKIISGGKL